MLDDRAMQARARRVVVSHWFDLPQIRVRVTRGVIHLQGHFHKSTAAGAEQEGSESSLRRLDAELRAIAGCRNVQYEMDNWIREESGGWRRRRDKRPASQPVAAPEQTVELEETGE